MNPISLSLKILILTLLPVFSIYGQVAGTIDSAFQPVVPLFLNTGQAVTVQPDGKILIGYDSRIGIVRLTADGVREDTSTFNPPESSTGKVRVIVVQADGHILIGGVIVIARLNPDGTLEGAATFNPGTGVNGLIRCMAVQSDGKILIGGDFDKVADQPRKGIARLNANGTVESAATFNVGAGTAGGFGGPSIYSIAVQPDGKILIAGNFASVDGETRDNIARLNADGTVESMATFNVGTGVNGNHVGSVVVQPDGKILLAGNFDRVNGLRRNTIARLHSDGSVEDIRTFNPGAGASFMIYNMTVQADGKILLCGSFQNFAGRPARLIARLSSNGSVEGRATFNSGLPGDNWVENITLGIDGKLLIAGPSVGRNGNLFGGVARLFNDAAAQQLAFPSSAQVLWTRGGTAPEVEQVMFDFSSDEGANWTPLGVGTRIAGGWKLTGLSLPSTGSVRARGRTVNANSSIVEQIAELTPTNPSADALVAVGRSVNFAGANVRNRTGLGQTVGAVAPVGGRKTFTVKVRNVGAATASYIVGGSAKTAGFNVRYFDDTNSEITAAIVRGTYQINGLAPSAEKILTLAITVQANAPLGAAKTCSITAVPVGFTAAADADTVRARVTVR